MNENALPIITLRDSESPHNTLRGRIDTVLDTHLARAWRLESVEASDAQIAAAARALFYADLEPASLEVGDRIWRRLCEQNPAGTGYHESARAALRAAFTAPQSGGCDARRRDAHGTADRCVLSAGHTGHHAWQRESAGSGGPQS